MTAPGRALVTGATGFVGANLVRRLIADGHEVHAVGRSTGDRWRLAGLEGSIAFVATDLADGEATRRLVGSCRPDWVFHLAAYGAYPHQNILDDAVRTNVLGMANLAQACLDAGVSAFVNAGSSSEYGLKDHAPIESEPVEPNSTYAATKASATMICRHLGQSQGAPMLTLRLYSAYGPYEEPSRLLPAIVLAGLRGGFPPLANPDTARDFIHVDDVVDAFVVAAERAGDHPGAVFNLGTGVQITLREVVEAIRRALAIEREPQWGSMPDRRWDTTVWVSDSSSIHERLGWRHRLDFEEGLRRTVDWFRDHPELVSQYEERRARS